MPPRFGGMPRVLFGRFRPEAAEDIEIAVSRHQVAVLRRAVKRAGVPDFGTCRAGAVVATLKVDGAIGDAGHDPGLDRCGAGWAHVTGDRARGLRRPGTRASATCGCDVDTERASNTGGGVRNRRIGHQFTGRGRRRAPRSRGRPQRCRRLRRVDADGGAGHPAMSHAPGRSPRKNPTCRVALLVFHRYVAGLWELPLSSRSRS